MNSVELDAIAESLDAQRPFPDELSLPSTTHHGLSLEDAYRIQRLVANRRRRRGERIVGRKVGLANPAAQRSYGASEPISGRLFSSGSFGEFAPTVRPQVSIECELAFLMKRELAGPRTTEAEVISATAGVAPAFEIIEDRLPTSATLVDLVSDNCSGLGFVLGAALASPTAFDFVGTSVALEVADRLVGVATMAAVMGSPVQSVTWLANKLGQLGERIQAGDIILTGALIPPVRVDSGHRIAATFGGGLGTLEVVGCGEL